MSIFKRRPSKAPLEEKGVLPPPVQSPSSPKSPGARRPSAPALQGLSPSSLASARFRSGRAASTPALYGQHDSLDANGGSKVRVDDFGRVLAQPAPAYGLGDDDEGSEMQLIYGYSVLGTTVELDVGRVLDIVKRCAQEIKTRGLDTPLVLSSMALDVSMEGTSSLIRSYIHNYHEWATNLTLAPPLDVGVFLKWGLARLVNDKGARGFLSWETYQDFKMGERTSSFPPQYCVTGLLGRLTRTSSTLLSALLDLFSSLAAYSGKNGMTPRRLAGLFSGYVFGLPDDQPFDETYCDWQRSTDALEHILLSYIRLQETSIGRLPTHLEQFIRGYPEVLHLSYAPGAIPKVLKGARVEEVTRVRKLARFHSRNLIQSAGTWEIPRSLDWPLFFPLGAVASKSSPAPTPIFTPSYRHLLNIRNGLSDLEDDGEVQRYKSVVEKEWGTFGNRGFKDVDPTKLEFDLSESERNAVRPKHETLDWGTFANSGFGGRETFAPTDLIFHQTLTQTVQNWPESQVAMDARLRQTEKMLPPFPYDTTPHAEGRVLVDVNFFEAWADVLVASGWARDELKESNFALVQWKRRPRDGELPKSRDNESDDRTEEQWVLVEEWVPREYRDELKDGKKKVSKRVSFLRSVRRKKEDQPIRHNAASYPSFSNSFASSPTTSSPAPRGELRRIDESVFAPGSTGETKLLTLSNVTLESRSYAPSMASSTIARHGHGAGQVTALPEMNTQTSGAQPPPLHLHSTPGSPPQGSSPPSTSSGRITNGIGGTLSSQKRESPPNSGSGGRGSASFSKPQKGFLARIGSRKHKFTAGASPYGFTPASAPHGHESTESHELPDPPVPTPPPAIVEDASSTVNSSSTMRARGSGASPSLMTTAPSSPYVDGEVDALPPPPPPKVAYGRNVIALDPVDDQRDSVYSTGSTRENGATDSDAYDGLDTDDEAEEGQVLFRGSREFAVGDYSRQPVFLPHGTVQPHPFEGNEPVTPLPLARIDDSPTAPDISAMPPPISHSPFPGRHESLPPSPKPDAEVPVDEEHRERDPRFLSGVSEYSRSSAYSPGSHSSRVSDLISSYQARESDVRLTQYGFHNQGIPTARQAHEQR